jgi:iron(III) transport system ATP-binding protein
VSSKRGVLPPERRRMGMVFQSYALWPHMSVFENVAFGLTLKRTSRREIRERAERALAMVGVEGLAARTPAALSGGQQQRVALARSLVTEPAFSCSTSLSAISTPSCANECASNSRISSAARGLRSCT